MLHEQKIRKFSHVITSDLFMSPAVSKQIIKKYPDVQKCCNIASLGSTINNLSVILRSIEGKSALDFENIYVFFKDDYKKKKKKKKKTKKMKKQYKFYTNKGA